MVPFHRFAMFVSLVAFAVLLGTPRSFVHAQTPGTEPAKAAPSDPTSPTPQIPDNDQYDKLLEAERRYRGIADGGEWPTIPDGDPMKPGQRYECSRLETLQKRLAVEGYRGSTDPAQPAPTARGTSRPRARTPPRRQAVSTDRHSRAP